MALTEAIAHLNKGLDLIAALPASVVRDERELGLRTGLGTAWMALKGWSLEEVWDSLHPHRGRATSGGGAAGSGRETHIRDRRHSSAPPSAEPGPPVSTLSPPRAANLMLKRYGENAESESGTRVVAPHMHAVAELANTPLSGPVS
jgi:hypothetical protein